MIKSTRIKSFSCQELPDCIVEHSNLVKLHRVLALTFGDFPIVLTGNDYMRVCAMSLVWEQHVHNKNNPYLYLAKEISTHGTVLLTGDNL